MGKFAFVVALGFSGLTVACGDGPRLDEDELPAERVTSVPAAVALVKAPLAARVVPERVLREEPLEAGAFFERRPPRPGATFEHRATNHLVLSVRVTPAAGEPTISELDASESIRRTEEVLATRGPAVTKVRVRYEDRSSRRVENGRAWTEPPSRALLAPIVLAIQGKATRVTDAKGKPLPKRDAERVLRELRSLGKPELLARAMPSRSLRPGERVAELERAFEEDIETNSAEEGLDARDVSIALRAHEGDVGVFDVALTLIVARPDDPTTMTIPLKGAMKIRTDDCLVTDVALEGPVQVGINAWMKDAGALKVSGEGKLTIRETRVAR